MLHLGQHNWGHKSAVAAAAAGTHSGGAAALQPELADWGKADRMVLPVAHQAHLHSQPHAFVHVDYSRIRALV